MVVSLGGCASDLTVADSAVLDAPPGDLVVMDGSDVVGPDNGDPDVPITMPDVCNGMVCGAACVDINTDVDNCGRCGFRCTGLPNVASATGVECRSGRCFVPATACAPGFAHCTTNAEDGCETNVTTSTNCGSCGNACGGATPVCTMMSAGSAYTCGTGCNTPPATMLCSGSCVDINTNPGNCGACGVACPAVANGSATCTARSCGVSCNAGYHQCSGTCADNNSPMTCGTMCSPCPVPTNGMAATCTAGVCGFTCATGFIPSGSACVPIPAPRPVAPISPATVTINRPTLRWELPSGVTGAHVQLCRTRSCSTIAVEFDATGTTGRPPMDLAPGHYWWRLNGRAGTGMGTAYSPTWQFYVRSRLSTVDTSWVQIVDVNGDGRADAVIGASTGSQINIHHGSTTISTVASRTIMNPDGGSFGFSIANPGDVNGDGYGDIVVSAPNASPDGRVYLYLGGASGLSTTVTTLLNSIESRGSLGFRVVGLGDVNRDGYADVAVAGTGFTSAMNEGRVYIHHGSATGLVTTPAVILDCPNAADAGSCGFGVSMSGAGDVNGDGYADLIVGAQGNANMMVQGRVYVYLGSSRGITATPATTITMGGTMPYFANQLAGGADMNADGYADFIMGVAEQTSVYLYRGGATGVSATSATTIDRTEGSFGTVVEVLPDFNGDGYDDMAARAFFPGAATPSYFGVYLYRGSSVGISGAPCPAAALTAPSIVSSDAFGSSIGGPGDMDGDGFGDVVVGASTQASAHIFLGDSTCPTRAAVSITGGPSGFGGSIAMLEGSEPMLRTLPLQMLRALAPLQSAALIDLN